MTVEWGATHYPVPNWKTKHREAIMLTGFAIEADTTDLSDCRASAWIRAIKLRAEAHLCRPKHGRCC